MNKQESRVSLLKQSEHDTKDKNQINENDNHIELQDLRDQEEGETFVKGTKDNAEHEELSHRRKLVLQGIYCINLLLMGLGIGAMGPTLWALGFNTNSSTSDMGGVFTARGFGWLVGSLIAGKLFEKFGRRSHFLMFSALLSMCIFLVFLPLVHSFWLVMVINVFWAVGMSWLEVGCNSLTIAVWRDKLGPYMQFLHFSFGIGATLSPFLIGLLITLFRTSDVQDGDPIVIGGEGEGSEPGPQVELSYKDTHEIPSALWTYWILAGISLLVAVPTAIMPSPPPLPQGHDNEGKHADGERSKDEVCELETGRDTTSDDASNPEAHVAGPTPKQKRIRYYAVIILVSTYLFLYVGAEASFGGWIFSYAVDVYGFSKSEGAYLSSCFWGALTAFRLVAVPVSMYLSAHTMLMIDMGGCLVSLVVMLAFVGLKSKVLLWLMTITFGASMASVYATAFSLPQNLNINITSKAASLLIIGVSIGDMVLPMLVGWLMRLFGPQSLPWTIFIMFIAAVAIYFVLVYGMNYWFCWWCKPDQQTVGGKATTTRKTTRDSNALDEEREALTTQAAEGQE